MASNRGAKSRTASREKMPAQAGHDRPGSALRTGSRERPGSAQSRDQPRPGSRERPGSAQSGAGLDSNQFFTVSFFV